MIITRQQDATVGETVKYYDYACRFYRIGKVCGPPNCVSEIPSNNIWCNFDDEGVPEAIDIIRTSLEKTSLDGDDDYDKDKDEDEAPEITEQMTCSHPADKVVISHTGMGVSAVKFKYCRKCGSDLGDI